jgi:hypothetical protein
VPATKPAAKLKNILARNLTAKKYNNFGREQNKLRPQKPGATHKARPLQNRNAEHCSAQSSGSFHNLPSNARRSKRTLCEFCSSLTKRVSFFSASAKLRT